MAKERQGLAVSVVVGTAVEIGALLGYEQNSAS